MMQIETESFKEHMQIVCFFTLNYLSNNDRNLWILGQWVSNNYLDYRTNTNVNVA